MDVLLKEKQSKALRELLKKAPKPQLHLHLDGSLSYKFIKASIERMKKYNPEKIKKLFPENIETISHTELKDWLWRIKEAQRKEGDKAKEKSNWQIFDFCNQFLQTREDLHDATVDLVVRLNEEFGVDYIEIRFAPVLHTEQGLTEKEVVNTVLSGFNDAKESLATAGNIVNGGIILIALRSFSISNAESILELASGNGVLAFDIAGDEGSYPLKAFESVFRKAVSRNINVIAHAGEWNCTDHPKVLENFELAVDIGVKRIGHGLAVTSVSDKIIQTMNAKAISIEVCLTGNCGNTSRCKSFAEHPVRFMLEKGITVAGFNCDNTLLAGSRAVGRPDPVNECVRALVDVKIKPEDVISIIENGYKCGLHKDAKSQGKESVKIWKSSLLPKMQEIMDMAE